MSICTAFAVMVLSCPAFLCQTNVLFCTGSKDMPLVFASTIPFDLIDFQSYFFLHVEDKNSHNT